MTVSQIAKLFRGIGPNIMTPYPLRYGRLSKILVYELSEGQGIDGKAIFGVTVFNTKLKEPDYHKSEMKHSLEEAESHLESLRKALHDD